MKRLLYHGAALMIAGAVFREISPLWGIVGMVAVCLSFFAELETEKQERQDLAVTCRECGDLAAPISGTRNRYRCDNCGNQFGSSYHGL